MRILTSRISGNAAARRIDESVVAELAGSMAKIGLLNPITVVEVEPVGGGRQWRVVAGTHRLVAARKLGWEEIEVMQIERGKTTERLAEISENLHRAELTKKQRAEMVAEWVELVAGQSAQLAQNESKREDGKGHRQPGGISEAARQLGMDRTEVSRAVQIASLSDEAKDAADELGLDDNQSALLSAAKKTTPGGQVEALRAKAAAAETPEPEDIEEPAEENRDKMIKAIEELAWNRLHYGDVSELSAIWKVIDDELTGNPMFIPHADSYYQKIRNN